MESNSSASYDQTIASDIFTMITLSREQSVNLDAGFQHTAFSNQTMAIRYLFFPKQQLLNMGLFPKDMQQRFKTSNILAIVEENGKALSVNLLCSIDTTFAAITSLETIETNLLTQEVATFAQAVRDILAKDFKEATEQNMPSS